MGIYDKQQASLNIANNLKNLRLSYGVSATAIADICEITRRQLYDYENGDATPNIYMAYRLAKVYDVTIDGLLT